MTEKEPKDNQEDEAMAAKEEKVSQPVMMSVNKEEWDKLHAEVKDYKDKNLRILAESENTRKRLQKEKSEMQTYAKENMACEFLAPIDQFATALSFKDEQSDEVKNWMIGFEMILTQFKDVLCQNEIRVIETKGKAFDPNYHEALEMEETNDYPPQTIIHEYIKGYMMGERVLRPAKVKVAKSPTDSNKSKDGQDEKKTNETIKQKEG
ncbi:MAG: Protein GrpE [Chlamydiae bacterium]|nr:Protein GrpE [Chlamydiota bacterium]